MKYLMEKIKDFFNNGNRSYFPLSRRGWISFFSVMLISYAFCYLLRNTTTSDTHVPLIFVMAVLIIALTTEGYFYGLLASLASVVMVNYAFTYPYNKLDYSIYGYPLTFFTMFSVSVVVSTMVTNVKNQERVRLETEKEKLRANLLRAVSHDLRTPLTAISGSISAVLDAGGISKEDAELLAGARDDAEWLHRMVENLLSVTRIDAGKSSHLHTEDELLEEVLSEAAANFKKRVSDIELKVNVPEEPLFVPMDAMLIEQVLLNLMDNAVVHGKTTTRISITAKKLEDSVAVSVQDNGCGIEKKSFDHLFDGSLQLLPQKGADSTRRMGIGLSVCKAIIQAHNGTLAAANVPEGGARISFILPVSKGDDTDDSQG